MKIAVISAEYTGPDMIYGDTFVHTRVKWYLKEFPVRVFGHHSDLKSDRIFEYEGVQVFISKDFEKFTKELVAYDPDVIAIHLVRGDQIPFFTSLKKPLLFFAHGFEVLSWRRRLMNYTKAGDLRYLLKYIFLNRIQLARMRDLVEHSNRNPQVRFVFVSHWLKNAAREDLGKRIDHAHVIPNGMDTSVFTYQPKDPEKRKKILLLRSFKARNYGNDIAMDAILLLSKKEFFKELEIAIYGEGYLFPALTQKVKHLSNVSIHNYFIENKNIPALHAEYGIFLAPSRLDTQGVSMCEAMASGLVPVTSPIGGIVEYAQNDVSAYLCQSPQEIAERIEYLYHHPEKFTEMSAQARKAIKEKCALEKTIPQELSLMKSVSNSSMNQNSAVRQCTRCVLGSADDPFISFDSEGVCSFCRSYDEHEKEFVKTDAKGQQELTQIIAQIKEEGKNKPYDCIIGLSGGVDSTYLALKAKEFGLRPLAVHFDNGWNSELAVSNIENIITKLGLELYTLVIDWEEFKDLQLSFLKASVIDIEVVSDHAIFASLYRIALQHRIKYILSGVNYVTESILPPSWIHDKRDPVHIRAIHKLFGKIPLKKYPLMNSWVKFRTEWMGLRSINMLNYFPYVKADVKKEIMERLQWRDYGGKHYESVFTRFYQGYILPVKFGVDKRKAHLSNLICSGQITKEEALKELSLPAYPVELFRQDYQFVLKKFDLTDEEFKKILQSPVKKHTDYPVEKSLYERFPVLRVIRPLWLAFKSLKRKL